jgi:hypothetical protein
MSLVRKSTLSWMIAAPCLIAGLAAAPAARAATIPDYFFKQGAVSKNCTEQHAGQAAHVATGLKFRISRDAVTADGGYLFQAEDVGQQHWAANWNGLKLEYRAGAPMTTVPADFECIPGQEPTSSFLTMSNYAQAAEPYYEQEHWYGLATIRGQLEHVLIFPRASSNGPSAVIVLQSVNAASTVQLDENGVIHIQ